MKKDLISIADLTSKDIHGLIQSAIELKSKRKSALLKGKTLAMIFEKPSLRTRVTFDVGIQQLGGFSLYLSPAEISLGKRESVHDTARNLERMVQGIMIRTFAHEIVEQMAKHARIPVINGLTDYSHPCQAMADFLTMQEVKGKLKGLHVAYVGDGNNVAHSLMFAGAQLGAQVWVATPRGCEPDAAALHWAQQRAQSTGGNCVVTNDPREAVTRADVVYTDVWASMGQEQEHQKRLSAFQGFQLNQSLLRLAKPEVLVMHCLPAHRGEEISDEVLDGPHSIVWDQAENRLHLQKAILVKWLG